MRLTQSSEDHHRILENGRQTGGVLLEVPPKQNPLGLPRNYDDFGRFRSEESLEHLGKPDIKGPEKHPFMLTCGIYKTGPFMLRVLEGTRDSNLDGPVADALDLVERISGSEIARQSIIRHAFRYFQSA